MLIDLIAYFFAIFGRNWGRFLVTIRIRTFSHVRVDSKDPQLPFRLFYYGTRTLEMQMTRFEVCVIIIIFGKKLVWLCFINKPCSPRFSTRLRPQMTSDTAKPARIINSLVPETRCRDVMYFKWIRHFFSSAGIKIYFSKLKRIIKRDDGTGFVRGCFVVCRAAFVRRIASLITYAVETYRCT